MKLALLSRLLRVLLESDTKSLYFPCRDPKSVFNLFYVSFTADFCAFYGDILIIHYVLLMLSVRHVSTYCGHAVALRMQLFASI